MIVTRGKGGLAYVQSGNKKEERGRKKSKTTKERSARISDMHMNNNANAKEIMTTGKETWRVAGLKS